MPEPSEREKRRWMEQWQAAELALARVRLQELETVDLARTAAALEPLSRQAMAQRSTLATSGLVQQQRLFHSRRGAP